ncbi:hypothetical protein, partial [Arenimonas composti]|uniref:hypothetical protein n=1 Tax=Arenimonas composti TaxID=370776 RepID=UPI001B80A034
ERLNSGVRCAVESLKRLRERLARGTAADWEPIAASHSGFSVGTRHVEWEWVESVAAFKRDMLTLDDVWFQLEGSGEPVMVCEEQPGFAEWERKLCEHFPSVAGWREQVIHPPFAENFTVLYRRT